MFWTKRKLGARLKVILLFVSIALFIKPLRNAIFPDYLYLFKDIGTFKLIRIHLVDFFYYIDGTPYSGSCQMVHDKLAPYKKPVLEDMPVYTLEFWNQNILEARNSINVDDLKVLDNFKPSLTIKEMKQLMYTTAYISLAFIAFNITHFVTEGSLIGAWRHHSQSPWDDDSDMMFDASQWLLAKEVVSCLPDIQLDMGSDYLWKAFHKDSSLWIRESWIKFPFVDLLPYKYDSDHIWPLTIWAKQQTIMLTKHTFPTVPGVFGGWPIMIPYNTEGAIDFVYGNVLTDCYSRSFRRREREDIPLDERHHLQCKSLEDIYPFVRRNKVDTRTHTVLEERVFRGKVLSSFNRTFHGVYQRWASP